MFTRKNPVIETPAPVEPSLVERFNSASAVAGYARSNFLLAALSLEEAANELDILSQDTQNQLDWLTEILTNAIEDSDANRATAKRLRNLVEGDSDLTLF